MHEQTDGEFEEVPHLLLVPYLLLRFTHTFKISASFPALLPNLVCATIMQQLATLKHFGVKLRSCTHTQNHLKCGCSVSVKTIFCCDGLICFANSCCVVAVPLLLSKIFENGQVEIWILILMVNVGSGNKIETYNSRRPKTDVISNPLQIFYH